MNNALRIGCNVTLAQSFVDLGGNVDTHVIYRVLDVRGAGRNPVWTIAPESDVDVDFSAALTVFSDDVRVLS